MKQDNEGVHFHNSLWASAFAGSSGTTFFWWWDQLDRQDAYGHYRPLAAFLADVSFSGLHKLKATSSKQQLHLFGYQGNDCAYIWLFNPQAMWWNLVIEKQRPSEIKGTTINIQGLDPGDIATGKTFQPQRGVGRESFPQLQSRISNRQWSVLAAFRSLILDLRPKLTGSALGEGHGLVGRGLIDTANRCYRIDDAGEVHTRASKDAG